MKLIEIEGRHINPDHVVKVSQGVFMDGYTTKILYVTGDMSEVSMDIVDVIKKLAGESLDDLLQKKKKKKRAPYTGTVYVHRTNENKLSVNHVEVRLGE